MSAAKCALQLQPVMRPETTYLPPLDISPCSTLLVLRDPLADTPDVGRSNTSVVAGVWHLARYGCEK